MSKNDTIARTNELASSPDAPKITIAAARSQLWMKGILDWKLDALQNEMKKAFYKSDHKVNVWLVSRRVGKSLCLCVLALEQCIKKPGSIVKFLAPEQKQIRNIIRPLIQELTEDCPDELRPKFVTQEGLYRLPNGSEIHLAGSDSGGAEKLRGARANLCIVDEAGFCNDLTYAVRTVLLPTMLTTGGKLVLSSTPPLEADHEFVDFIKEADEKGVLIKKTIYDCPRYTREFIQKEILSHLVLGEEDPNFKREYLVELIRDDNLQVIPEFNDDLAKRVLKELPPPTHFDSYVAADWGVTDLTVVLFAYYDFKAGKLVIQDEVTMSGARMNTKILAEKIAAKEKQLWQDMYTGEAKPVYLRVCDNNLLLIQDLSMQHNLTFLATDKIGKEGYLNQARIMLQDERIIISPKCKVLINHLKYTMWNKSRSGFKRTSSASHGDAIDALIYLCRNVIFSKNPYPKATYTDNQMVIPDRLPSTYSPAITSLKKIFVRRRY